MLLTRDDRYDTSRNLDWTFTELGCAFGHARHADGVASMWGLDDTELAAVRLPHAVVLRDQGPSAALDIEQIPAGWVPGSPAVEAWT